MRILMVNFEFPPIGGGGGKTILCLLKEFTDTPDLAIDVLTSAPTPGITVSQFGGNIRIYKIGLHKKDLHYWRKTEVIEWLLKAGPQYRRLIEQNNYDFAHALFGFPSGWLCWRNVRKLPYMVSLLGSDVPGRHTRLVLDYKILGPIFKAIWKNASVLIACSAGLKQRALRFTPAASIRVIPNGIELDRFYPAANKLTGATVRLVTVGRLSVTKRPQLLIEAVELLKRSGYSIHLAIIGGGPLEEQLRQMVSQKALQDAVEITGLVPPEQMPQIYRDSSIYVSASIQEGMSNAMLEAMASALPIVTTRCEGVDELIADNGVVLEQADAGAPEIAEAVRQLADNQQMYKQMSAAARRRAEMFTWPAAAGQYIECYQQVALSSKHPAQ
jgi:glycosyltransferase involved in cell wall biosynthesis